MKLSQLQIKSMWRCSPSPPVSPPTQSLKSMISLWMIFGCSWERSPLWPAFLSDFTFQIFHSATGARTYSDLLYSSMFDISGNTTWSSCSAGLEQFWMRRSSSMTEAAKVMDLWPWPTERRRIMSSPSSITSLLTLELLRSTWPDPGRKSESVKTLLPRRAASSWPRSDWLRLSWMWRGWRLKEQALCSESM